MGWWSIDSVDSGGIDFSGADSGLYNGDGPADILDGAIGAIIKEYEQAFGRKPYSQELQAVWSFCTNSLIKDELDSLE